MKKPIPSIGSLRCDLCGAPMEGMTAKPGVTNICGVCFIKIEPFTLWTKLTLIQKQKAEDRNILYNLRPYQGQRSK